MNQASEQGPNAAPTRPALESVAPLLLAAGILLGGNGLQVTLVAVRANQEGFSAAAIGLFGTTYYVGFVLGCLLAARLILRSGHIRVFAALASLAAIAAVLLVLVVEPWLWMIARAATGFAFAGLSTVIESWLNERAENQSRARRAVPAAADRRRWLRAVRADLDPVLHGCSAGGAVDAA